MTTKKCTNCPKVNINTSAVKELNKALDKASFLAESEDKMYIVLLYEDKYIPECLECYNKLDKKYGTIIAYVR